MIRHRLPLPSPPPDLPRWLLLVPLLWLPLSGGCDFKKLAASQTADVIKAGMPTLNREHDLHLAAEAIPGQLKLIEGLLHVLPDDPRMLSVAAEGFGGYAFGFVEDKAEKHDEKKPEKAARERARARELYLRGMTYALRWAYQDFPELGEAINGPADKVAAIAARATREQVPQLFWVAYNLAQAVNAGKELPQLLAALPKAEVIMRRVLALDERFFNSAPHLFFGTYYGSRPRALGGDPAKAKAHFDRALMLTQGKFLLVQVFYARQYAVQIQDRALFERLLRQVLAAPINIDPEQRLANAIAKRKAARYLRRAEELF